MSKLSARAWFYGPLGFDSTRGSFPVTGSTVRKADQAMRRTDAGLCPHCGKATDDEGECAARCQEAE